MILGRTWNRARQIHGLLHFFQDGTLANLNFHSTAIHRRYTTPTACLPVDNNKHELIFVRGSASMTRWSFFPLHDPTGMLWFVSMLIADRKTITWRALLCACRPRAGLPAAPRIAEMDSGSRIARYRDNIFFLGLEVAIFWCL
jgi:hypothetical protein